MSTLANTLSSVGVAVTGSEKFQSDADNATMSMRVVQIIVGGVEHAGVPRDRYLRASELDNACLEDSELRLSREDVFRLTEIALDVTADPAFGLHCCERLSEHSFTLMAHLLAHASNLRDAFNTLFQFGELLNDDMELELVERDGGVTLRCDGPIGNSLRYQRTTAEMVTLGMFKLIRQFKPDARVEQVCFAYAEPDYRREYTRVFDSAEHFNQPFTGLTFDAALMDSPSPYRDEDVWQNLRSVAEQRIAKLRRCTPYAQQVTDVLMQQPAPQRVSMAFAARSLALSERSLQRRLADAGQSYSTIATAAAAATAKRLLEREQLSIKQTAHEMGYADVSSFHRAFKRWTGQTPIEFRARRTR